MQAEFEGILRLPMGLQPFNKEWKTILFTDYSAKGIGYALTQEHPEDKTKKHLIFCGSSSLSEKQKRLPAIYGENLGICVALEKCRFWLRGCPHFWVYTDHRSLESIYNSKPIDEISDEISDIVVSTYRYNFTVKYVSAKDNLLADFLSRNPIWTQEQEEFGPWIVDNFGKKITVKAHISSAQIVDKYEERLRSDPLLEHIRDQGALDPQYTVVIQAIQEKRTKEWVLNTSENPCREYASVWDRLGTLDTRDYTLSHTEAYSLHGLSLELRTQAFVCFCCMAWTTAVYCGSKAPWSRMCSSRGSECSLSSYLFTDWTLLMCASTVIFFPVDDPWTMVFLFLTPDWVSAAEV